uniref:Putative ovule protein n=1 Tax=Solanum chacoense TaxID=4108 RepID=A0A0V0GR99_SOLCH
MKMVYLTQILMADFTLTSHVLKIGSMFTHPEPQVLIIIKNLVLCMPLISETCVASSTKWSIPDPYMING